MEKTILETGSSVKTTLKLPGKKDFFTQEAFKTLRTNLQFCGQDICTVVITSCNENEGKTTITLQLAKSLAELNKRVLVIDADMRKSVTLTLLETMGKYQVKNLIFSSSATVYGNPSTLPITEACPTGNIASPYGWTKYMIEQIVTDYAAATLDFSAVIFRYFNPVGAHPSGLIGEAPNGTPNNLYSCQLRLRGSTQFLCCPEPLLHGTNLRQGRMAHGRHLCG